MHRIKLTLNIRHTPRCPYCAHQLPADNPHVLHGVLFCPDCYLRVNKRILRPYAELLHRNRTHEAVEAFGELLIYAPRTQLVGNNLFPCSEHAII